MNWLDDALPWRNPWGWCMTLALVFLFGLMGGLDKENVHGADTDQSVLPAGTF